MLYFTSPSITAIPEGNHYVALVAFEANTGHLWTWENFADAAGYGADTGLAMAEDEMATGPSIGVDVAGGGTAAVAFRGADGDLWTWNGYAGGDAINYADTGLPIAADTSPSIDTALPGSGVAVAFQNKDYGLWTWYGYAGTAGSGAPSGYATPGGGVDPRSATSHRPREQPHHRLGAGAASPAVIPVVGRPGGRVTGRLMARMGPPRFLRGGLVARPHPQIRGGTPADRETFLSVRTVEWDPENCSTGSKCHRQETSGSPSPAVDSLRSGLR